MPVDLRVEGAEEFARVAKLLKETGDTTLRKEMLKGIQRATKPLKERGRDAARAKYPHRGGLNELIAGAKFSTRSRGGGKYPRVTINVSKAGHDIKAINKGVVRHPVFGNKNVWVTQQLEPNVISDAFEDGADDVRKELVDVLEDVAKQIARKT